MSLNLKQQGAVALAAIGLIFLTFLGVTLFAQHGTVRDEGRLEAHLLKTSEVILPLTQMIDKTKFDVVQVQQWLTDISATRGLDGMNDGPEIARDFAEKFSKDSKAAIALARRAGLGRVAESVKKVQAAFPAYYATGQKMAKAYVDEGPAGGNRMMSSFDGVAEAIGTGLDETDKYVAQAISSVNARKTEILESAAQQRKFTTFLITGMSIFAVGVLALMVMYGTKILNLIIAISAVAVKATEGNLGAEMPDTGRQDEIGHLERSFNSFLERTREFVRGAALCTAAIQKGNYEELMNDGLGGDFADSARNINEAIAAMAEKNSTFFQAGKSFENGVQQDYEKITDSMHSLQEMSKNLLSLVETSNDEAKVVASTSSSSSNGVQAVATATEELSASIQEISRQVSNSSLLVSDSAAEALRASEQIKTLSDASQKIGNVVEMITGIAEQTNLLALNATIESARAGEAGRGFAVVAQEVKALASQTGAATDEVRAQVETIQEQTDQAVSVIESISGRMNEINETVTTIAAAVEQQGSATNEISCSISTVASETDKMMQAVNHLLEIIDQTRKSANEMGDSTSTVNAFSGKVSQDIDAFMGVMQNAAV